MLQTAEQYRASLKGSQALTAQYLAASEMQELGQHDKAVEAFKALVASAPAAGAANDDVNLRDKATYKLALSLFELGRTDEMAQVLSDFGTQFPKSPLAADVQFLLAASDAKPRRRARGRRAVDRDRSTPANKIPDTPVPSSSVPGSTKAITSSSPPSTTTPFTSPHRKTTFAPTTPRRLGCD